MIVGVRAFLVLLVIVGFYAVILAASHLGERRRCDTLTASHSPAAAFYSCPASTAGH